MIQDTHSHLFIRLLLHRCRLLTSLPESTCNAVSQKMVDKIEETFGRYAQNALSSYYDKCEIPEDLFLP